MKDRRSVDPKNPAWIAIAAYVITAALQWGAFQARITGLESDINDLRNDIRTIQKVIMQDGRIAPNSSGTVRDN